MTFSLLAKLLNCIFCKLARGNDYKFGYYLFTSSVEVIERHLERIIDLSKKLVEVCAFGAGLVDGLRSIGQNLHWITDDDEIISTENAQRDAMKLFGGLMHTYPKENPQCSLGIASKFDDDRLAEDLVAISDLAAGAFSEMLIIGELIIS